MSPEIHFSEARHEPDLSPEEERTLGAWAKEEHTSESFEERLRALEEKLKELSKKDPYQKPVGWLRCHRGIDTVTAMSIVAELHGVQRFPSARALMCYLGLVPGEESTGGKARRRGSRRRATLIFAAR